MIRGVKLQSHPRPLGRGEVLDVELITNGWCINLSCLCNEVSIKTPKNMGSEGFGVGEQVEMLGEL